jgi:hypothetical protein
MMLMYLYGFHICYCHGVHMVYICCFKIITVSYKVYINMMGDISFIS